MSAAALHRYIAPAGAPVLTHAGPLGRFAYLTSRHAAHVGLLQDVTPAAAALGFVHPVAMTAAARDDAVTWTDADSSRQRPQSETARLAAVLAGLAAAAQDARGSVIRFSVARIPRDGRSRRPAALTLRAECAHGADGTEITVTTIAED